MTKNVFVIGADTYNLRILQQMSDAGSCRFHPILCVRDLYSGPISFDRIYASLVSELDAFDGHIDAIIGFWDFPVTSLLPLLRRRYGLPGGALGEVVACEHKYWSRRIQQSVISEYPRFGLVDLSEPDPRPPEGVRYPMWLKPVKSFASVLAFSASGPREFGSAVTCIREGIGWIGEPFEALLNHVQLPDEIARIGGQACLAEEAISGRQVTVEGYRYRGEVVLYGIVESVRFPGCSSFLRYQYPAGLPTGVQERLYDISTRVVRAIGLEGMTFNIEYFWDPQTDRINLLEINPRHSQSHAELFENVDGMANHQVMLRLALDEDPRMPYRQGRYPMAAKWFVRRFRDGRVVRHPDPAEIARIEAEVPGSTVELVARTGDRLGELPRQDSYSYHLASVYVGASNEAELTAKFDQVAAALDFRIEDV